MFGACALGFSFHMALGLCLTRLLGFGSRDSPARREVGGGVVLVKKKLMAFFFLQFSQNI